MIRWIALLMIVCATAGCADLKITKHNPGNAKEEGVHFFKPHPYVMVTSITDTTKNEVTTKVDVVYLPGEEYVADVKPGWGTIDGSMNFNANGTVSTLGVKSDSQIPETITAMGSFVTAIAGAIPKGVPAGGPTTVTVRLYRADYDGNGMIVLLTEVPMK